MTPNIERLEACYQANVGREHICMGSWDSCLIGGYDEGLANRADALGWQTSDGGEYSRATADYLCYQRIAEHFAISAEDAVLIFGGGGWNTGESALIRLRVFIDANKPDINEMDYKNPSLPVSALEPALT